MSEQMVYSKETLKRHLESGDESGPLAESGFKGHPLCKFCRQRFYDSNELYKHMESAHEHCFLCRRAAPHQYVYFRHYKELEGEGAKVRMERAIGEGYVGRLGFAGTLVTASPTAIQCPLCPPCPLPVHTPGADHFTKAHHPCPHPNCLERKFVVFDTEYELKAHFAAEHGDEVKMSAAQRRQAMTIPLNLQYRSHDDEETEPGPSARLERAGGWVTMGKVLPS